MKNVKLFDEFIADSINEATTDATIESFISLTQIAINMGVFTDDMFIMAKRDFVSGIHSSLKLQVQKISADDRKVFLRMVAELMKPLEESMSFEEFIKNLKVIVEVKNNLISRMQLTEGFKSTIIKSLIQSFSKYKKKSIDWWESNKKEILTKIFEIVGNFLIDILSTLLNKLTNTNTSLPKFVLN